ncbi:MAG TPA: hypothetical protein VLK23_08600 [Thermodesulfobacteriota bacterium]|nr:hypothetical protein [Thermodesulfobacteriota bacterium]
MVEHLWDSIASDESVASFIKNSEDDCSGQVNLSGFPQSIPQHIEVPPNIEIKTRGKPGELEKPVAKPERVVPANPAQHEKPVTRPERVTPPKPAEAEKPVAKPERAAPAKPAEKGVDKLKKVEKPNLQPKKANHRTKQDPENLKR